jgi:hypothetical protein
MVPQQLHAMLRKGMAIGRLRAKKGLWEDNWSNHEKNNNMSVSIFIIGLIFGRLSIINQNKE